MSDLYYYSAFIILVIPIILQLLAVKISIKRKIPFIYIATINCFLQVIVTFISVSLGIKVIRLNTPKDIEIISATPAMGFVYIGFLIGILLAIVIFIQSLHISHINKKKRIPKSF